MTANIEPSNWQVEPDPEPALYDCRDCGRSAITDQMVETCEHCESNNIERYEWDAKREEWTL